MRSDNERDALSAAADNLPGCSRRTLLQSLIASFLLPGGVLEADPLPARRDTDDLYTPEVDAAVRRGIDALIQRIEAGGVLQGREPGKNPGVLGLAGLAMLSVGGQADRPPLGDTLDKVLAYVLGRASETGFIHDPASQNYGPMYEHGFGTLFLAECYGTTLRGNLRPVLDDAIDVIVRSQNDRGGWRYQPRPADADLSVTVCQVMALRAARNAGCYVPAETVDRAVDYIRRCQNADGGFAYQVTGGQSRWPLTAAAIVALQNAGLYGGDELERAYAYINQNRREVSSPTQTNYYYYAHYYAVQAYWQRGGEAWATWYKDLRDTLLRLQNADGTWTDYVGRVYATAMACLVLSVPRSVLPIFQK